MVGLLLAPLPLPRAAHESQGVPRVPGPEEVTVWSGESADPVCRHVLGRCSCPQNILPRPYHRSPCCSERTGPCVVPSCRLHSLPTERLPLPLCPRLAFLLPQTSLCLWTPHASLSLPLLLPGPLWLPCLAPTDSEGGWCPGWLARKKWPVRASCPNWILARASTERALLCPPARHTSQGLGDSLADYPLPVKRLWLGTGWNGRFQNQVWIVSAALEEQRP